MNTDNVPIVEASLHVHLELSISNQIGTTLRPDQPDAVEAFTQHGPRGLIAMPTGSGKTVGPTPFLRGAEAATSEGREAEIEAVETLRWQLHCCDFSILCMIG